MLCSIIFLCIAMISYTSISALYEFMENLGVSVRRVPMKLCTWLTIFLLLELVLQPTHDILFPCGQFQTIVWLFFKSMVLSILYFLCMYCLEYSLFFFNVTLNVNVLPNYESGLLKIDELSCNVWH